MILNSNIARAARVLLVTVVCLASVQGSRAADAVTESVLACAKLAETKRLSCYDQLAARLSAQQPRDLAAAASATAANPTATHPAASRQPSAVPQSLGTPEPQSDADFGLPRPMPQAASSSMTARVTEVHLTPQGGATVELDNGQRWRELGTADLELSVGDTVKISRGALGSFWLSAPSNRGSKVTRLR